MTGLEQGLRLGLTELALALDERQIGQLLNYLGLIQKWTRVYNLTAVREPSEMLTHHLLDSLAVIRPLRSQLNGLEQGLAPQSDGAAKAEPAKFRLLDVGSGAGLPGVVIAICCPELLVDCVDTVAKKAAFIQQVALTLRLPNLRGLHARVENLTQKYQVVSSRAFASLADFTSLSSVALAEQGIWLAMKGKHPADEIAALPAQIDVFHVEQVVVPGLQAERCIVWLRKVAA